jgi:hypothetical protein
MRPLLRFAAPLLLALPLVAGCKQGQGDRCQLDSDCSGCLVCVIPASANISEGGTCEPAIGCGSSAGEDAAAPLPGQDAGPDLAQASSADLLMTPSADLLMTPAADLTPGPDLVPAPTGDM